ncbi:MAG TPA: hypothetical protein VMF51_00240 [Nocardioides sp.]|uniref:hypothetical protein n=1 Tax=Nocardioides sp. TaxID=35761 RepID=UPI002BD83EBA|nr:hypothetical protein [Nocardioides sp.]HTW13517.1 hypothetical protein [Nocardioides sp.]
MSASEDRTTGYALREHEQAPSWKDDDRKVVIAAFAFAISVDAAIIALFMFITWVAYATD